MVDIESLINMNVVIRPSCINNARLCERLRTEMVCALYTLNEKVSTFFYVKSKILTIFNVILEAVQFQNRWYMEAMEQSNFSTITIDIARSIFAASSLQRNTFIPTIALNSHIPMPQNSVQSWYLLDGLI